MHALNLIPLTVVLDWCRTFTILQQYEQKHAGTAVVGSSTGVWSRFVHKLSYLPRRKKSKSSGFNGSGGPYICVVSSDDCQNNKYL